MDISVEGVVLPNKALSNLEIDDAANRLGIASYRGCYFRDDLPKVLPWACRVWEEHARMRSAKS